MNPFQKEQGKFSVIVPIYKKTYKTLEKCLSALEQQEYKTFEVIVVFDGKNKAGQAALKKLTKKFDKLDIKSTVQEWGGAPKARNTGAAMATGDFLTFIDPDVYLYPQAFRLWANAFEDKKINRVWGVYDVQNPDGSTMTIARGIPTIQGKPMYEAFKFTNYCSGAFPMRREVFPGWSEEVKSLQDWDLAIKLLKPDFKGEDHAYLPQSFFVTDAPYEGGISDDSHKNWIERTDYIRNKHGIPKDDIVVSSQGAPWHGMNAARILGADFLPMPSFKDHKYKKVYLLGFYTKESPQMPIVTRAHMDVFRGNKGKNIIHWIGSDVMHLHWNCSFQKLKALRKWFKENKVIHLCEADFIKKELKEIGIDAKVIPIPPDKLYDPMPLPKEFSVAIYNNPSEVYNHELMMEVVRSMPDVKFYFFGNDQTKGQKGDNFEHLGFVDLDEWMPKFSCNLRALLHDGLPLTPLQFMTAGRNVVTNLDLKGAIKVEKDRVGIVAGLRKAQKEALDANVAQYWKKELDHKKYDKAIRGL